MPITRAAKKALRVSGRKAKVNLVRKNTMKKALRDLRKTIDDNKGKEAKEMLPTVYKAIDKAAKRGIIKPNNAARKKARASRMIKNASSK